MKLPSFLISIAPFFKSLIIFIIFPIISFILGMKFQLWFNQYNYQIDKEKTFFKILISPSINIRKKAIFNLHGNPESEYSTFQITSPIDYFATDDEMLTSYDTQGGRAPPRIILVKGYQVSGRDYLSEIRQSRNDCIVIWSTNGFDSVDDWNQNLGFKGILNEIEQIAVGTRQVKLYKMKKNDGEIFEAFLSIGNEKKRTYFFHTCNKNNQLDFIEVIQSIKFRDDLPYL